MGSVTAIRLEDQVAVPEAIASYLATIRHPESQRTVAQYAATLRRFREHFASAASLSAIEAPAAREWFDRTWGERAPATYNRALGVLRSAYAHWLAQGWALADPTASLRRRRIPADRPRALTRADVDQLLGRDDVPLRDRVLWRLAYESAARVGELLALDVRDLDLPNRRARVVRKGGAVDTITWQTGTARLLPKLLRGRKSGPLFLTERRARVELAAADLDPASGRARLSYRQAAGRFTEATASMAGGPWTLHQLRHSALTHAAEDGASTSTLLAYSGHASVRSLARYARVSAEALGNWQAQRDPARRR